MSEVDRDTLAGHVLTVFERFCAVKPLPRERLDWIEWLWDLHSMLSIVLQRPAPSDGPLTQSNRIGAAQRVIALLYSDPRGSTPWGSSTPLEPSALALTRDLQRRGVEALERIAASYTRMSRLWTRDTPTNEQLELAEQLKAGIGRLRPPERRGRWEIKADGLELLDTLHNQASELEQRLRMDTFEAGATPANDLFEVLRDLPEGEREALRLFEGISGRLRSALQAFWSAG